MRRPGRVSIPTIYASVGPKPEIVLALVDLGDAEVGGSDPRDRATNEMAPAASIALDGYPSGDV